MIVAPVPGPISWIGTSTDITEVESPRIRLSQLGVMNKGDPDGCSYGAELFNRSCIVGSLKTEAAASALALSKL